MIVAAVSLVAVVAVAVVVSVVFRVAFAAAANVAVAVPAAAVAVVEFAVAVVVGVEHYHCCISCYRDPAWPLSHPRIRCEAQCASVNSDCQANRTECYR